MGIDEGGVRELSRVPFSRLQNLSIGLNDLNNESMNFLKKFETLKTLSLRKTKISTEGVINLSRLPLKRTLVDLDLSKNEILDDGITPLR